MKIIINTFIISFMLAGCILGQSDEEKHATIKFAEESIYYGEVLGDTTVTIVFTFENTGNDTLKIYSVKPGCGCTVAELSSKAIAPGQNGEIKALFDTKRRFGNQKKSVEVKTNDPVNPSKKLSFTVIINRS